MNKVCLIGNLTRDPELRATQSGISVCTFTLAVSRRYTDANGERQADFINIQVWRGLAESCAKYLSKGRKAAVVGSLQSRSYEDKDGNKRTAFDVVADEVDFLPSKNDTESAPSAPTQPKSPAANLQPVDEELPF